MIKISVLYPNSDGCHFDMDYYLATHMPLVRERMGAALKDMAVDQGIGGGQPGDPAAFVAMGHLFFDSVDDFQAAFGPHADEILGDIPNYTNIEPTVQVSDVKM